MTFSDCPGFPEQIETEIETDKSDHVHDQHFGLVERFNRLGWWNADGAHEESRLLLDDDVDQIHQAALRIIIVRFPGFGAAWRLSDGRDEKVNAKR